jgi:hypothetical protein
MTILNSRDITLLTFGDGKLCIEDGKFKLSRRAISVELNIVACIDEI